jgi:hypothetical protein
VIDLARGNVKKNHSFAVVDNFSQEKRWAADNHPRGDDYSAILLGRSFLVTLVFERRWHKWNSYGGSSHL